MPGVVGEVDTGTAVVGTTHGDDGFGVLAQPRRTPASLETANVATASSESLTVTTAFPEFSG